MKKIILLAACILATSSTLASDEAAQEVHPKPKPAPCLTAECPEVFIPTPKQLTFQFGEFELKDIDQGIEIIAPNQQQHL